MPKAELIQVAFSVYCYRAIRLETERGELVEVVPWPHRRAPGVYVRRHGRLFMTSSTRWRQCAVFVETDTTPEQIEGSYVIEDLK